MRDTTIRGEYSILYFLLLSLFIFCYLRILTEIDTICAKPLKNKLFNANWFSFYGATFPFECVQASCQMGLYIPFANFPLITGPHPFSC